MGRHILRRVRPHSPELIDLKMALMNAYPFLGKQDWSGRIQFNGNAQDQKDW